MSSIVDRLVSRIENPQSIDLNHLLQTHLEGEQSLVLVYFLLFRELLSALPDSNQTQTVCDVAMRALERASSGSLFQDGGHFFGDTSEFRAIQEAYEYLFALVVESNMGLVVSAISRLFPGFNFNPEEYKELRVAGKIGLITALQKFDPENNTKFSTYATFWIEKELRISDSGNYGMSFSEAARQGLFKIARAIREIKENKKDPEYDPSIDELARETGISTEEVELLLPLLQEFATGALSLDTPLHFEDATLHDVLPSRQAHVETQVVASLSVDTYCKLVLWSCTTDRINFTQQERIVFLLGHMMFVKGGNLQCAKITQKDIKQLLSSGDSDESGLKILLDNLNINLKSFAKLFSNANKKFFDFMGNENSEWLSRNGRHDNPQVAPNSNLRREQLKLNTRELLSNPQVNAWVSAQLTTILPEIPHFDDTHELAFLDWVKVVTAVLGQETTHE